MDTMKLPGMLSMKKLVSFQCDKHISLEKSFSCNLYKTQGLVSMNSIVVKTITINTSLIA